jgi:predicted AlkP superfamily pyrophosphatase or phosphodiesterase
MGTLFYYNGFGSEVFASSTISHFRKDFGVELKAMKRLFSTLFVLLFFIFPLAAQKPVRDLKPTVILIALDGFRYDYLEKYQPPFLNKLAREGVRAKWLIPSFPTKTFPNHYTVATGLYPANHGLVENNIYDFGAVFGLNKREEVQNPRWWGGEPIWVTAKKQGQIAASYFFPGTETAIQGVTPDVFRVYNGKVPNEMRVDKVLSWLDFPAEKRPTIITLYFSDVDDAGHEFSPDAEETRYAVLNVDRYLARLYEGLKQREIADEVNLILFSDHGMASVNLRNTTFLDDYFDLKLAEQILWTGEIVQIFPKAGNEGKIFAAVKNLQHTTCWRKSEIPARLNYGHGKRVAPIVCSSAEGWITTNRKRHADWLKDLDNLDRPRGAHGYDNNLESMRAIFIAHGEAFKQKTVVEPFPNVNIYHIMTEILNLKPAPNDGNFDTAKAVLKNFRN